MKHRCVTDKEKCKECKDKELCDALAYQLMRLGREKVMQFVLNHPRRTVRLILKTGDPNETLTEMLTSGTKFSIEYIRRLELMNEPEEDFDHRAADQAWDEFMLQHVDRKLEV